MLAIVAATGEVPPTWAGVPLPTQLSRHDLVLDMALSGDLVLVPPEQLHQTCLLFAWLAMASNRHAGILTCPRTRTVRSKPSNQRHGSRAGQRAPWMAVALRVAELLMRMVSSPFLS